MTLSRSVLATLKLEPGKPSCIGKIFKATNMTYISNRGEIVNKKILRLMKRKSCPGCELCGWIEESVQEYLACGDTLIGFDDIEHGKLYSIGTCNEHTDWETGAVEDYDMEVVEYKGK